jgi:type I restriction enzyme M protein
MSEVNSEENIDGHGSRSYQRSNTYFAGKSISSSSLGKTCMKFTEIVGLAWGAKEILRGNYKQSDYGDIILPFVVLRRLERVLEPTKKEVVEKLERMKGKDEEFLDAYFNKITRQYFHNRSKYNLELLLADPNNIHRNIKSYLRGFSPNVRDIFDNFRFDDTIDDLHKQKLLYQIVQHFAKAPLDLETISNHVMGTIYEELIRKTSEAANEEAGDHFTPREIIELMVNLLFSHDKEFLKEKYLIRTVYDPAAGTGGMLSVASEFVHSINPEANLDSFGQELNSESYAICKSDMMLKGLDLNRIAKGNSLTDEDAFSKEKFHYMLSNPPFGVDWRKYEFKIKEEAKKGLNGRYGAGLPRKSDGSLLFLLHMISKMRPVNGSNIGKGGSRIAIVLNGSPLFSGDAGSGESNIRKWIIEKDMLETIIALPSQLFYNTSIFTYIWIVTNHKEHKRKGKIQLINAVKFFKKMNNSLGQKRNYITPQQMDEITKIYEDFQEGKNCKIFSNEDFGYKKLTIERPIKRSFEITENKLEELENDTAFKNIIASDESRSRFIAQLKSLTKSKSYEHEKFYEACIEICLSSNVKMTQKLEKVLFNTLSVRDDNATPLVDSNGDFVPDPELRDYENVPLKENIEAYFSREVKPYVPDAWIQSTDNKVGYEISFPRYFYEYEELPPIEEIDKEIQLLVEEISEGLRKLPF